MKKWTAKWHVAFGQKSSFFGHFYLVKHDTCGMLPSTQKCIEKTWKNTSNMWWSKVQGSFVNELFEYQLYLGNMVRSLFKTIWRLLFCLGGSGHLLYRPPFILKLETPTFFGSSFFSFPFSFSIFLFILLSLLFTPFFLFLSFFFSHTKKDQVHKREKKKSGVYDKNTTF